MDLEISMALLQADMQRIKRQRDLEVEARDVLSSYLDAQLDLLFPNAPGEWLDSNGNFANELARGAGEIADAVASAGINWTGPWQDSGVDLIFTSELVRLMAVDDLVSGKIGLFPRIDENGEFEVEVMAGYLHPIFKPGNALKVEEVIQVLPDDATKKFLVRRYASAVGGGESVVEEYGPVEDWFKYSDSAPTQTWPQPHAEGRLPCAFLVTRRDAHRQPFGLVAESLSAFRRFMKTAINTNAVQETAGFPEIVVKSDKYLQLLLGERRRPGVAEGQEDPAITEIKKRGARKIKFIGENDVYELLDPVDLTPHITAEADHKRALLDMLRSPDLSGGNQTEVALAERTGKSRAVVKGMCENAAKAVTEALRLSAGLSGSNVPEGVLASLTPTFPADVFKKTDQVANLFSKSVFKRSQALLELQSLGWNSVTDEDVQAAQESEKADATPILPKTDNSTGQVDAQGNPIKSPVVTAQPTTGTAPVADAGVKA